MKFHFTRFKLAAFILFCLAVFLLFYRLNSTFLTNWDEAWYATVARTMARSGDFITPYYQNQIWYASAPLYLWILAFWFRLSLYSVVGVRLISALTSLITVWLVYSIGRRLHSRRAGFIAALVLITSIHWLYRSRLGNLDIPVTFFHTLAVYSVLQGKHHPRWFLGFGLSLGLGFLAKNIFGLIPLFLLPFLPINWIFINLGLALAIALPWHLLAYLRHRQLFLHAYFGGYAFYRLTHINPSTGSSPFWYVNALKHGFKIWSVFLPPAFLASCNSILRHRRHSTYLIPLLWFLLPLALLTLAQTKNNWYLIPLFPPVALLLGMFFTDIFSHFSKRFHFLVSGLVVFASVANLVRYRSEFFIPETVAAEVKLSHTAYKLSLPSEPIILDDIYHPVAHFYSDRPIIPIRFTRAPDGLVTPASLHQATASARLALTSQDTLRQLIFSLHANDYQILDRADDKLLIRLVFDSE